jgi:hypothetical protein
MHRRIVASTVIRITMMITVIRAAPWIIPWVAIAIAIIRIAPSPTH